MNDDSDVPASGALIDPALDLETMHGGHLTPDNVRLAHRLCNQRDYEWRTRINAMLGERMSLEEIAEKLNATKVPTVHGTNRWTASVRKAFVS